MLPELVPVRVDDRVGGIGDHLVIQPPLGEFGPGEGAGRVRNAVALPRVRLAVLDLPLGVVAEGRVFQVPHAGVDLRVGEGRPRARQGVDVVPAHRGLIAGEDLADRQTMPQTAGAQRTRGFGGRPKPSRCAKRRSDRSSKPWPTPTRCRPCRSPDSLAVSRDSLGPRRCRGRGWLLPGVGLRAVAAAAADCPRTVTTRSPGGSAGARDRRRCAAGEPNAGITSDALTADGSKATLVPEASLLPSSSEVSADGGMHGAAGEPRWSPRDARICSATPDTGTAPATRAGAGEAS